MKLPSSPLRFRSYGPAAPRSDVRTRDAGGVLCWTWLLLAVLLGASTVLCAEDRGLGRIDAATAGEPRHALVIGNGSYDTSPLRNPSNDAKDIAATLRLAGFDVDLLIDAVQRAMEDAIRRYTTRLRDAGCATPAVSVCSISPAMVCRSTGAIT